LVSISRTASPTDPLPKSKAQIVVGDGMGLTMGKVTRVVKLRWLVDGGGCVTGVGVVAGSKVAREREAGAGGSGSRAGVFSC
jgi:hypothetical protein